jgi:hypothetical protein
MKKRHKSNLQAYDNILGFIKKSGIYDYIQLGLKNKFAEKYNFRLNH